MGEADLGDDETEEAGDTEEARERRVLQIFSQGIQGQSYLMPFPDTFSFPHNGISKNIMVTPLAQTQYLRLRTDD